MYKLGNKSNLNLKTCNSDLQLVIKESIKISEVDFSVVQGSRTVEQQQEYFDNNKSNVNPKAYSTLEELFKKGKHLTDDDIRKLSDAVDLCAYVNGKANWEDRYLCYIGGVVTSTAKRLYLEGRIKKEIRWGGNWDRDGEIITDQRLKDLPHYESIEQ